MASVGFVPVRGSVVEVAPQKPNDSDLVKAAFLVYLTEHSVIWAFAFFHRASGDLYACLREVAVPEHKQLVPSRYVGQDFIDYCGQAGLPW